MKISKDELRLVARSKGWKGGRASKDEVLTWLKDHNIDFTEIGRVVAEMRRSASGKNQAAASLSSITRDEVVRLIEDSKSNVNAAVDPKLLGKLIAEAVAKAQPARLVIDGDSKPVLLKERTHPLFEKVLRLVRAGVNVLLVGPAGCGKSFLSKQVAKALKRKFGTLHCSAGVSESQVTGWLLPTGKGGAFEFVASQFAVLYTAGESVFLIDEIDAADPNMLTVLNGALANGTLHIPQCPEKPEWKRGEDAAIIAAANTYGQGADMLYVGRNQLDAATLDRFYVIQMQYDTSLEAEVIGNAEPVRDTWAPAAKATVEELKELGDWVLTLRKKVEETRLRRVVSTRTIQKAIAARRAGIPSAEVRKDLVAGWTADELVKVGV